MRRLDEATSALGGDADARIMQTIYDVGPANTGLMIAHPLTTLKDCDRIVELEGSVKRAYRYGDL